MKRPSLFARYGRWLPSTTYAALPMYRSAIGFTATYDADEFERISAGFKSSNLDQKWNIVFDPPWLMFFGTWTGMAKYGVQFESGGGQTRVADSWVNNEGDACDEEACQYHRRLVGFLIDVFLLRKPSEFPFPPGVELEGSEIPAWVQAIRGDLP